MNIEAELSKSFAYRLGRLEGAVEGAILTLMSRNPEDPLIRRLEAALDQAQYVSPSDQE